MVENGMRLQITCTDNGVTIIDTVTDKLIVYQKGLFVVDNLNHEDIINNLMGLEQSIISASVKRALVKRKVDDTEGVMITELAHCKALLRYDNEEGTLDNGLLRCTRNFKSYTVLNAISKVISIISRAGNTVLSPATDTCRRISDLGLFIIRDTDNFICLRNSNRNGNILLNCLYNNTYFKWLYVDIHKDENTVYIVNCDNEVLTQFKLDDSFTVYFVEDSDLFKEGDTDE